jgi:hypothetical protein
MPISGPEKAEKPKSRSHKPRLRDTSTGVLSPLLKRLVRFAMGHRYHKLAYLLAEAV